MKNKTMKFIGLAIASLIVPFCTSCNLQNDSDKIKIVATIFPEYDWVMNVMGDKKDVAEVTLLLDSGVDLHSYQPTPKDIVTISKCDLFIYVGGESDEWVKSALDQATNEDMKIINLIEVLGDDALEEEIIDGMEEHEHEHEESEEHEEEKEYDEHVWLSLKCVQVFVQEINEALGLIDQDNASYYQSNADSYIDDLQELDARYEEAVDEGSKNTLLFADRFPFRYLVHDYSLSYFAAFIGCSAETEASFETIAFLANKVDELNLNIILKIESSDGAIANTVKNATTNKNQTILVMDSIQSASTQEYLDGRNYLSIMEQNLTVLEQAVE